MSNSFQILFFLEALIFMSVIFMHLSRKSSLVVTLYVIQSVAIAILLVHSFFEEFSMLLMFVAVVVFAVKVIIAPHFFRRLIHKHQMKFNVSTYLNGPMTLVVLAILTAFTYSSFFRPLAVLSPESASALLLAVATMFISVFLIINRRGALSQMIGILSLENAIVSFAILSELEQASGLQFGILFDILLWVIIATVFASMVYRQFGSLDVTAMRHLKEE